MADIFISYASQDRDTARELAQHFEERGVSVWWDRTIPPGRVFDEVIQEALAAARCVVVLWSAHSVRSNWVKAEAEEAMAANRLLPVMIDDLTPPMQFKRIQAANLIGWSGNTDHPEFRNLLASVERLLARPAGTTPVSYGAVSPWLERSTARRPTKLTAIAAGVVAVVVIASLFTVFEFRSGGNKVASVPNVSDRLQNRSDMPGDVPASSPHADQINLVAPENGGELVTAADEKWAATVDGDETTLLYVPFYTGGNSEAVFGFKDGRSATFDSVEVLIPATSGNNVAEFELLTSRNTSDGPFESIQVFKTRNILLVKERYQRFAFKPRTGRFIKFRILRAHAEQTSPYLYEWRLLGTLN